MTEDAFTMAAETHGQIPEIVDQERFTVPKSALDDLLVEIARLGLSDGIGNALNDFVGQEIKNIDDRPEDDAGDYANNLVATGMVWGIISSDLAVRRVEALAENTITVRLTNMKSPYRITVERLPEDDED